MLDYLSGEGSISKIFLWIFWKAWEASLFVKIFRNATDIWQKVNTMEKMLNTFHIFTEILLDNNLKHLAYNLKAHHLNVIWILRPFVGKRKDRKKLVFVITFSDIKL